MQIHRDQFPLLKNHPDLVYLDAAATALKPSVVLEAEQLYGTHFSTNATRGLYPLAEQTSTLVEETRDILANFIQCEPNEIIFSGSTTSALNMLARSVEEFFAEKKGEIIVSGDAHHSLILPWSELARRKNWNLHIALLQKDGFIDEEKILNQLTKETSVIALTLVSNVYGVVNDVSDLVQKIRVKNPNVFIVVDAAQAVAHIPLDVEYLGVDAFVFSGHKLYGPTGVGVLYMNKDWQEKLTPSLFGGGMVRDTSTTPPLWKASPEKFEAGTLPLSQIFGLKKAVEFIQTIDFEDIQNHEQDLVGYTIEKLHSLFGKDISILGSLEKEKKIGLLSFTLQGAHPHDIATLLGEENICVRAGEHCASFLHRSLSIPATTRISFGVYTTKDDVDFFVETLSGIYKGLKKS